MPVLFFLPWVKCEEAVDVGGFQLLPYERGASSQSAIAIPQVALDAVLGTYGDLDFSLPGVAATPIQRATIVAWRDESAELGLPDAIVFERLGKLQYVAFAAVVDLCGARASR